MIISIFLLASLATSSASLLTHTVLILFLLISNEEPILITIFLLELFFVFKDITLKNTSSSKMNISELLDKGNNNTESIGMFLYTDFFIVFQISGFLLLVAMIGAIVLAKNENLNIKSQKIIYQKSLDKKKVIKLK